jgi:hypothetical protein
MCSGKYAVAISPVPIRPPLPGRGQALHGATKVCALGTRVTCVCCERLRLDSDELPENFSEAYDSSRIHRSWLRSSAGGVGVVVRIFFRRPCPPRPGAPDDSSKINRPPLVWAAEARPPRCPTGWGFPRAPAAARPRPSYRRGIRFREWFLFVVTGRGRQCSTHSNRAGVLRGSVLPKEQETENDRVFSDGCFRNTFRNSPVTTACYGWYE